MKISEIQQRLAAIKSEHGDIQVTSGGWHQGCIIEDYELHGIDYPAVEAVKAEDWWKSVLDGDLAVGEMAVEL